MPESQAAAPAQEGGSQSTKGMLMQVVQSIALFIAIQFAMKQFMGGNKAPAAPAVPDLTAGSGPTDPNDYSLIPQVVYPLWPNNTSVDFSMYISPSVAMPGLDKVPAEWRIVNEQNFSLVDWKDKRDIHTSFSVPKQVQNNGTLWAHFYVGQTGSVLDPASPSYDPAKAYRMSKPLTQYLAKKKVRKTRSLLAAANQTEDEEAQEEKEKGPTLASFYHPNITLSFIPDSGNQQYPTMHAAVRQFYSLEATGARDESGKNGWYYPVLYLNTFWQLKTHMVELNTTIPYETLPINVHLDKLSNWKFSLMASIDEGMKETAQKAARGEATPSGGDGSEMELFKEILLDSNIYLLGTTVVVSIFHMIFEMLAFKSDVSHWRKKKDNVGTSVRTILSNVVMQLIIFLYLMDNNEKTSWMILFGQGMGIAIEAWKVTKAVNVRLREPTPGSRFSFLPYVVVFEDKHKLSETEEKTEEYDKIAFQYMTYLAIPLLLAYAVYSLMYDTHKSWYSFIITTLVGSVYAYGFLMMVPSLYINYRLKSVAHMPARAMTYKFLNTFIDDLFAFTIKMPTLHRLATLRDDVIFFVYIYQAWAYKVDYSRVNEFGQGGGDEELEEKIANKPLAAAPDSNASVKEGKDIKAPEVKVNVNINKGNSIASGKDKGGGRKRKG